MRGGQRVQTASVTLGYAPDALHASPLPPANYKGTAAPPLDPRTNMAVLNELEPHARRPGRDREPQPSRRLGGHRPAGDTDALAAAIAQGIRASLA